MEFDKFSRYMNKPVILTDKSRVYGVSLVSKHNFICGNTVPIYDIKTESALTQLIGHAKFINKEYGDVYYRGVCELYDNVLPSLMRKRKSSSRDITKIVNQIKNNEYFHSSLKLKEHNAKYKSSEKWLRNKVERANKLKIEGLIQHYAGKTRLIDVVDNHWVALWMGLYKCEAFGRNNSYFRYIKREAKDDAQIQYLYILLLAIPHLEESFDTGVYESDKFVKVDLRKSLPSIYLRPHAQHAIVIGKRENLASPDYDMATQVVAILRIDISLASKWLGDGSLLTQDCLFPPAAIDQGYDNLLLHPEIFVHPFTIINYF